MTTALSRIPLFAGVDQAVLQRLEAASSERTLLAGELLFDQGDPADDLHVVLQGRLRVIVTDAHGTRDVAELGPGSAVGELALLTGAPRAASVRAVRDTRLLVLPGDVFAAHFAVDAALAAAVARELARQVQRSGGMPLRPARPALLTLRGLHPDAPVAAVGASLAAALEPFGPVAVLTGGTAETIAAAEERNAHVLLVESGGDPAWAALCAR
ncbi:MAG: cyclic nucleotide-binding domain-containing protein, partial [Gaiella sp.]